MGQAGEEIRPSELPEEVAGFRLRREEAVDEVSEKDDTLSSQFKAVMTVSRFGSATTYSKKTFSIDRIDKIPMKIS